MWFCDMPVDGSLNCKNDDITDSPVELTKLRSIVTTMFSTNKHAFTTVVLVTSSVKISMDEVPSYVNS